MSTAELTQLISECCNDVLFTYKQKKSGITSEVKNYVPVFQAWHGTATKEYSTIEELMSDKFYSGKSLEELMKEIEFTFA